MQAFHQTLDLQHYNFQIQKINFTRRVLTRNNKMDGAQGKHQALGMHHLHNIEIG